jgi:hypothetical protein
MDELALDIARRNAGLTLTELWLRYFALGGEGTPGELESFLHGASPTDPHEHSIVAHAIYELELERSGGVRVQTTSTRTDRLFGG